MSNTPDEPQPKPRLITIDGKEHSIGGLTVAAQDAEIARLREEALRNTRRGSVEGKVDNATQLTRDVGWDWMENYGHTSLMNIRFISDQIQSVGALWDGQTPLTAAQKAEALRQGLSYVFAILIRFSQGFDLLFDVVSAQIDAARDVDAPPER